MLAGTDVYSQLFLLRLESLLDVVVIRNINTHSL